MRSEAQKKAQKKWRLENKEKVIAYRKSEKGKKAQKRALKKYLQTAKGRTATRKGIKRYQSTEHGKVAVKISQKKYKKSSKGKNSIKISNKKYAQSEKGKAKQSKILRAYYRRRIKKDPAFKLSRIMRNRLQTFLKRKGLNKSNKTMELVGCSKDFLREHLEKQFKPGMNWSNHNFRGWHVDHIVPLSKLDCSDPDQLKRACHYSNLQPLWAEENFKKHNSLY